MPDPEHANAIDELTTYFTVETLRVELIVAL